MSQLAELEPLQAAGSDTNQFLTFLLDEQEFGIEILQVQELRNYTRVTPIPNMPNSVKGVMNLRGTVVPIIDLRIRFQLNAPEPSQFTVIVVVNVGNRIVGLVVDAVSDVLNVEPEEIEAPPEIGASLDLSLVRGYAKSNDRLVTLLNVDAILCREVNSSLST